VRAGAANPLQNTGTGGQTLDIRVLANGFADTAAQVAFCATETCTVSGAIRLGSFTNSRATSAPVPFRLALGTRIGGAGRRAASGGIHGDALAGCRTVASASVICAASTRRSVLARNFR
jgi:hypothetical protein